MSSKTITRTELSAAISHNNILRREDVGTARTIASLEIHTRDSVSDFSGIARGLSTTAAVASGVMFTSDLVGGHFSVPNLIAAAATGTVAFVANHVTKRSEYRAEVKALAFGHSFTAKAADMLYSARQATREFMQKAKTATYGVVATGVALAALWESPNPSKLTNIYNAVQNYKPNNAANTLMVLGFAYAATFGIQVYKRFSESE